MEPMTNRRGSRADDLLADWADLARRTRRPAEAPTDQSVHGLRGLAAMAGPAIAGLALVVAIGALTPDEQGGRMPGARTAGSPSPSSLPAGACPVTRSNGVAWPRAGDPPAGAYGSQGLVVGIEPEGVVGVPPAQQHDGHLWAKLGVWREPEAAGTLSLTGRRLDRDAGPIVAQVPDGYGQTGLQIAGVGFPTEGCWELTARSGPSVLKWVVRVQLVPDPDPLSCAVTIPNGAHTSAWPASDLDHGEGGLFTALWPGGVVSVPVSEVDRDGIGWMKFLFQREGAAAGALTIEGRRIGAAPDDPRAAAKVEIPDGYGTSGVQATAIGFPAEGCWEITARSGTAELRFVTWVELSVVSLEDLVGEPAPALALERLDGGPASGPAAPGRPAVVTFWGSWCPACTGEPATLAEAVTDGAVDVVLIAVKDVPDEVRAALGAADLPVLLDPTGEGFARYGGSGLPFTVFIDGDGILRSFVAGPLTGSSLEEHLPAIVGH